MKKTIWIDAELEVVRSYFIEEQKLSAWSGVAARLDPRPGGIYELDMGQAGILRGRFVEVTTDRIVQEIDAPDGGRPSRIDIRLTREGGGTLVEVEHTGLAAPFDKIASRGWDHHLARLSVCCTGGSPGPDRLCSRSMATLLD